MTKLMRSSTSARRARGKQFFDARAKRVDPNQGLCGGVAMHQMAKPVLRVTAKPPAHTSARVKCNSH